MIKLALKSINLRNSKFFHFYHIFHWFQIILDTLSVTNVEMKSGWLRNRIVKFCYFIASVIIWLLTKMKQAIISKFVWIYPVQKFSLKPRAMVLTQKKWNPKSSILVAQRESSKHLLAPDISGNPKPQIQRVKTRTWSGIFSTRSKKN